MNEKYEQLIAGYIAGDDVGDELLQACRENPELLKDLAEFAAVERLLVFNAEEESDELFIAEVKERLLSENDDSFVDGIRSQLEKEQPSKSIPFPVFKWVVAACLVFACSLLYMNSDFFEQPTVAHLGSSTGTVWGSEVAPEGEVKRGLHKLYQGYAELMMDNGVKLTLEAPIEFEIKSVDLVQVNYGRLVARVPEQAIGFTVITPSSEVVDLGTEFGIDVNTQGASEVHVIEGEVKTRALKEKKFVNLLKDDARAFDENQQIAIIKSQPGKFLRSLPGRSTDDPQFLHWSFDDKGAVVSCGGTGIDGKQFPGTLESFNGGEGPLYQNGQFGDALYFNGEGAHVATTFPGIGENNPRTVAFWAKVPQDFSITNGYGMISWGLMEKGAAWQISPNPGIHEGAIGRVRVGTMKAPVIGTTDLRDNRWHHIAIVMYGGRSANTSTHILLYVDGKLEKTSLKAVARIRTTLDDKNSRPLTFGKNMSSVGGGTQRKGSYFKGWLDEVYIFDSALDQEQIRNIMQHNRLAPLTSSGD